MTAQEIDQQIDQKTFPNDGPADTRMMGIVHSALRRDLVRLRLVLGTPAAQEPKRRKALAEHAVWLMDFLHHHHTGEDEGLYPLVVRRNPDAAALCERMDVDHDTITPAMDGLRAAAERHLADPGSPDSDLLAALAALDEPLVPHLAREELEMMPVVSASISHAEWVEWHQSMVHGSMTELAFEGHWLIDGLDEEHTRIVVGPVPAVPRFILVKLLGGAYRRKRALLWDDTPATAVPPLHVGDTRTWTSVGGVQ
jgi:hemerythrin-like domain-containing protein